MTHPTSEQLAARISAALTSELQAFLDQPSAAEAQHNAEIESARHLAATATHPIVANALKQAVRELEACMPDGSAPRRQEAAEAVLAVVGDLRLPLAIVRAVGAPKASLRAEDAGRGRMTRHQMRELLVAILKALPVGTTRGIVDLAAVTGATVGNTRSALIRLAREGKVVSTGVRGRGAGWRRV